MKSIFELESSLSLVLTKLEYELGLAQPQLVLSLIILLDATWLFFSLKTLTFLTNFSNMTI